MEHAQEGHRMAGHGRERGDARRRSRAQATRVAGSCRCVPRVLTASALVLCLATGLAGCGQASSFRVPAPSPDSAKLCGGTRKAALCGLTVGYVGVGMTLGSRAAQAERNTVDGLRRAGANVLYFRSQSLNPQPQIEAAQRFANAKADALIVDPQFSNVWGDAFATMRSNGIKIILVDRKPLSLRVSRYDTYVGANYGELARRLARRTMSSFGLSATRRNFEDGGVPRTAIVSSLLGSAPDVDATQGWTSEVTGVLDTVTTAAVGENPEDAVTRLRDQWNSLAAADRLPHVIFATNTLAATATLSMLRRVGAVCAPTPEQALARDAAVPRTARGAGTDGKGTGRGWNVAVVALGQESWLRDQVFSGTIAFGQALPSDYSKVLVSVLRKVSEDRPLPRDVTIDGVPISR